MPYVTSDLHLALEALHSGEVLAIPTETVYGLAADATQKQAIHKVYDIKNRPYTHPLILHVAPEWDLTQWAKHIPSYVFTLKAQLWPGPLTFVLNKQDTVLAE